MKRHDPRQADLIPDSHAPPLWAAVYAAAEPADDPADDQADDQAEDPSPTLQPPPSVCLECGKMFAPRPGGSRCFDREACRTRWRGKMGAWHRSLPKRPLAGQGELLVDPETYN